MKNAHNRAFIGPRGLLLWRGFEFATYPKMEMLDGMGVHLQHVSRQSGIVTAISRRSPSRAFSSSCL